MAPTRLTIDETSLALGDQGFVASGDTALVVDETLAFSLGPGESRLLTVALTPTVAGDYIGYQLDIDEASYPFSRSVMTPVD